MKKRILMAMAAGLFAIGVVGPTPAQADGHGACGGNYLVSVEGDTGQGVTYCSDGTLEPFIPPDGDGTSGCGGQYPVAVETESVDNPVDNNSYSYCSDGTLDEVPLP